VELQREFPRSRNSPSQTQQIAWDSTPNRLQRARVTLTMPLSEDTKTKLLSRHYSLHQMCITLSSGEILATMEKTKMLILLIVLILVFGFGGYRMGPGLGYYGGGGISLILVIVLILLLLRVI
jgi:hypothetical protein